MADGTVQVPQSFLGGALIDNSRLTVGGNEVYRQRVEVYSGETLPVSGPLTDTQLRASAVPVSGPLTDAQLRAAIVPVAGEDFTAARLGLISGKAARNVYVLGRRTIFNAVTPFQDVATYLVGGQNGLNAVAVGTQYFIVSTNAADAAAGAGAHKVRIVSLDSAGNQQVTEATLTGTTKVSIGTGYTAFQWMEVSALGSGGGTAAVGNIAIFSGAGAAAAENTTVERILATGNRSLSGRYTIPTGYKGYLMGWTVGCPGSQAMDIRLRAECFAGDRAISPGIFHFQASAFLASASAPVNISLNYPCIPAGAMVKASVYPAATTGTPRVDVNFHMILVAD